MHLPFNLGRFLNEKVREIAVTVDGFDADFEPAVRPAEPRFGDFQANGAFSYAKKRKANPRALATALAEQLGREAPFTDGGIAIEVAGPGFLNFTLSAAALLAWLERYRDADDLRSGARTVYAGETVVVDYPSANTAKQTHIGHLRPMVIGEAVQRLVRFCGATVIRDNHIGDWGTNFGTLIRQMKQESVSLEAIDDPETAVATLERLYKAGTQAEKDDPAIREDSRAELVKLQEGDPENTRVWERVNEVSTQAMQVVYAQLGLAFEHTLGESFYRDKVGRVYQELQDAGLAQESEGALVVFHPEHPRFKKYPFLIRKKDGASNYASTDLATVLYRVEQWQAREVIYVTDGRQQDHFQQLFLTTQKWFEARGYPMPRLRHVWFGVILGSDGKAIKTRTGEPILLKALLEEAVERARQVVAEKNPELPAQEQQLVARTVGLGAVRYFDLSSNRTQDYVFDWERMLAFDGNTAPYLLYAVARIHAIFRKAQLVPGDRANEAGASPFETETELALARKLAGFPAALDLALAELRPHFLCTYLYELAGQFSSFYNADRVIVEAADVKARRLVLCARTLWMLETGLHLLGLETLERM
ncbi:MAG: arginine--tRNA ligase [Opitutales bacterium]